MDDLLKFLATRIDEDGHYAADTTGSEALPDSHLPMPDSIEKPADGYRSMVDPWDGRTHGLT
ncbi:hypothetical protein SUDANB15_07803 (plasmid) [Streptomyces sp. enrichment culture]|uniref:hypothetical protein n=1 Tax=Streptomyces sp. enrichment culture TaxID=1795815 RepID=UPI003F55CC24